MTPRTAFLRTLPAHGFAPSEADVAALGAALPAGDIDRRFENEVRAFAREFWALQAGERKARWDALAARAMGGTAAWLHDLAPGLGVVHRRHTEPDAAELAAVVRDLFVLRPRVRADRRLRWLTERAADFPRWVAAARVVLAEDMPLARLEPRLFDWLARGTPPPRFDDAACLEHRDRWRWRKKWKSRLIYSGAILAVVVHIALLSVDAYGTRARQKAGSSKFTRAEIQAFLRYERGDQLRPPPMGWREWMDAGRPGLEGAR